MKNYAQHVKEKLLESIQSLVSLKEMFVMHQDKDFTRNRKLSFETLIKQILEMEGNTLAHELRHYFSFSLNMPTVSAFVQRRALISPDAFLYLFHTFNFAIPFENLFEHPLFFSTCLTTTKYRDRSCRPQARHQSCHLPTRLRPSSRHRSNLYPPQAKLIL